MRFRFRSLLCQHQHQPGHYLPIGTAKFGIYRVIYFIVSYLDELKVVTFGHRVSEPQHCTVISFLNPQAAAFIVHWPEQRFVKSCTLNIK